MAFKASKERKRRTAPFAQGSQLIPSAATAAWYGRELRNLVDAMVQDYKRELVQTFEHPDVEETFSQDASTVNIFTRLFKRLDKKWAAVFKAAGERLTARFIEKTDSYSAATVKYSLSNMGVEAPVETYTKNLDETLKAGGEFNLSLISGIQEATHKKIQNATMLSLTSSDPSQQGTKAILEAVTAAGVAEGKRAEFIARDQNAKLYSSLNIERMKNNGVNKFQWVHSSAGKEPRHSHLKHDGEIFEVDDPRLWQEGFHGMGKGDLGPPGWAINCRCRVMPVIDLS